MAHGRRLLGRLVLVLAVTGGVVAAREVGASHNFPDVPPGSFYHDFVQFLVDNGITSGCSVTPPLYCGEQAVTRGQMAVFLKRLSDLVDQRVAALQAQVTALQTALGAALGATPCVRREGNEVIFEGCNVHVRSGSLATDAPVNGLGNLIIGYNENNGSDARTGSHNLVIGRFHSYSSHAGLVAGVDNTVSGPDASVTGGAENVASGSYASVSGGQNNTASGAGASVSGGALNTAGMGTAASVSGGQLNTASGPTASVSGGRSRSATGEDDWAAGTFLEDE
jgi:hypothetical protein